MNKIKEYKKYILGLAIVTIIIVILAIILFVPPDSIRGKSNSNAGFWHSDFVPDYESEDQINRMGNTNSNYLHGAIAAGQGNYHYYIVDKYYIYKERKDPYGFTNKTLIWSPADTGNSGRVNRLSVCGDWLYFLLSDNLCRVRTDGSQFAYLIMSDDDYETRKYVVYKGKVYLKKQTPISATSTNDYIYEYNPDTLDEKSLCDANNCIFLGMEEDYIVLYDTRKEEGFDGRIIEGVGYVKENIYIYKTTGELISNIKLGEEDDHSLRIYLSDEKMFCFGFSDWSRSLSLNSIKVITLKDGKTIKKLNSNPKEKAYINYGQVLVSDNNFILYHPAGMGYIPFEYWTDYSEWIQINDDSPDDDISVVGYNIYYTVFKEHTMSGETDLFRVSISPLASETHDFEKLSN